MGTTNGGGDQKNIGRRRLIAPTLLLIFSIIETAFGLYVWSYRTRIHLQDPTTYHVNTLVTLTILVPAGLTFLISGRVLIDRLRKISPK